MLAGSVVVVTAQLQHVHIGLVVRDMSTDKASAQLTTSGPLQPGIRTLTLNSVAVTRCILRSVFCRCLNSDCWNLLEAIVTATHGGDVSVTRVLLLFFCLAIYSGIS